MCSMTSSFLYVTSHSFSPQLIQTLPVLLLPFLPFSLQKRNTADSVTCAFLYTLITTAHTLCLILYTLHLTSYTLLAPGFFSA